MLQKRIGRTSGDEHQAEETLTHGEAARAGATAAAPAKHEEEHVSLFWRIFGGTLLSMIALGSLTLYNNITSNVAELRAELSREREARAELVRKDEFNSRSSSQYERIRALDALRAEYEGFKERVNANAAVVDALKKETSTVSDIAKKDAAAIEILREKVAAVEALKKDVGGVEVLRERHAAAAAELKSLRDDLIKVQQEQERNKAADLERKTSRDSQHKQIEESLKEIQKGLQDCREKLARLEGTRGVGAPVEPQPAPRPAPVGESKGAGDIGAGTPKVGDEKAGTSKPGPAGPTDERD